MTEEDAKMVADIVIEYLNDHRYITEEQYGRLPATLAEDLAPVILNVMNQ